MNDILMISNLVKKYVSGNEQIAVLNDITLNIPAGKKIIITGKSGCGKSTLLNLIAGLDTVTSGSIIAGGKYPVDKMNENELTKYRADFIGLVFQFHYLLKDFSTLENVMLRAFISGTPKKQAEEKAAELLNEVGLGNRLHHIPSKLSGGERQRAAVARALINNPTLILADEPTGNLDTESGLVVENVLFSIVEKYKKSLVLVTHDMNLASRGDICYEIKGGGIYPKTEPYQEK